jgi:glycosyltransferase involved in cell wall biosynthesis
MKTPKVSVVVPAYNAQEHIKKCVTSLLQQSLADIEVIVVNDGSTDNTAEIVRKISVKDLRLKLVTQTNQSVGVARMQGVLHAVGEYVAFADSDDTMQETMLQKLYENAQENGSDIVVCGYRNVDTENHLLRESRFKKNAMSFEGALLLKINSATWNKIYKRELFVKNKITFTPNIFCEDLATTPALFYFAKTISYVDEALYNYYINPKGASQAITKKNIDHIFIALGVNKKFLQEQCLLERYELEFHRRIFLQLRYINQQIDDLTCDTQKKELIEHFFEKLSSNDFFVIPKQYLEAIFLENSYVYLKLLAFEIYRRDTKSIYLYGKSEALEDLQKLCKLLDITIEGVLENDTLKHCNKEDLADKTILIISQNGFEEMREKIYSFMKQNDIHISVL